MPESERITTVHLFLTSDELEMLDRQESGGGGGGWQSFLLDLQKRVDRTTNGLILTQRDIERIVRYAFGYGQGGWEDRLHYIFGRVLGSELRIIIEWGS